eukprot:gb/GECH01011729.1/.p1 GENE.gb/GECH01011729.1/~~gb/GECH01011729.1/.p1  ORF type:complete len:174 (+),score=35.03 gb/GECH01011729.1/:1-522(+)
MTSTYWNLDERPPQFTYEGKNAIGLPWLILDSGLPLVLKGFNCHGSFASLHLQEQHEHDLEDSQTSNVHSSLLRRYINQRQEHSFPLASPENNKLSSSTCNNNNNNNHNNNNGFGKFLSLVTIFIPKNDEIKNTKKFLSGTSTTIPYPGANSNQTRYSGENSRTNNRSHNSSG